MKRRTGGREEGMKEEVKGKEELTVEGESGLDGAGDLTLRSGAPPPSLLRPFQLLLLSHFLPIV